MKTGAKPEINRCLNRFTYLTHSSPPPPPPTRAPPCALLPDFEWPSQKAAYGCVGRASERWQGCRPVSGAAVMAVLQRRGPGLRPPTRLREPRVAAGRPVGNVVLRDSL